jgi:hypothetical protein
LLNRRYCQQSGSMSSAQVCGDENRADGGCRQGQPQLDRVSFAHMSKPSRTSPPWPLRWRLAIADSCCLRPAFGHRRTRRNKHRKLLRPPADGAHASDGRCERDPQATRASRGDEFVANHSRSLQRAARGGANSRGMVRTPFELEGDHMRGHARVLRPACATHSRLGSFRAYSNGLSRGYIRGRNLRHWRHYHHCGISQS